MYGRYGSNYNEGYLDDNSCIISVQILRLVISIHMPILMMARLIGGCVFELAENYDSEAGVNDGPVLFTVAS